MVPFAENQQKYIPPTNLLVVSSSSHPRLQQVLFECFVLKQTILHP
jgi:hypothetical protein